MSVLRHGAVALLGARYIIDNYLERESKIGLALTRWGDIDKPPTIGVTAR